MGKYHWLASLHYSVLPVCLGQGNYWSNYNPLKLLNTKPLFGFFKEKSALHGFWKTFGQVS